MTPREIVKKAIHRQRPPGLPVLMDSLGISDSSLVSKFVSFVDTFLKLPCTTTLLAARDNPTDPRYRTLLVRVWDSPPPSCPSVRTLDHEDRYVRGKAVLALRRIGTPEATDLLMEHLITARWCPLTTTKSQY